MIFATNVEVLADGHVGIERRRLRQIAGMSLRLDRLIEDVEPGDLCAAVRGRHVAGEDAHRGGLARAIGAKESQDLALLDRETDVVYGCDAAVAFGEVLDLDHR